MIIAIDGPAASGKGTLGKRLAAHYGFRHLDTGLIYRAVAKSLVVAGHGLDDVPAAVAAAKSLDPSRFDEASLKAHAVGEAASQVSAIPEVREVLLAFQRGFGRTPPGAVLDGRDIGTVIFPDADVKIFVTATPDSAGSPANPGVQSRRWRGNGSGHPGRHPAPRRARHAARDRPAQTGARCALARYHSFGYRRRIPGRRRHCRSRPNGPGTRTTAFPSWRLSPFAPRFFDGALEPEPSFRSLGRRAGPPTCTQLTLHVSHKA